MQMLLKEVYRGDPTSAHVQYMLTEIADECRHSTMFAKAITRYGAPAYGPRRWVKQLARILPVIARGPSAYASILVGEEIPDRMQRENLADESVQPLIRMVNRIHVLEEARHVSFARQEIAQGMAKANPVQRAYHRLLTAVVAYVIVGEFINPAAYAAVGLDPREARRQARNNPHHRATIREWSERAMSFLGDAGLVGGPGTLLLRRASLLD
jgi:P-aminobenzoate N-oxygenase AurF